MVKVGKRGQRLGEMRLLRWGGVELVKIYINVAKQGGKEMGRRVAGEVLSG